MTGTAKVHRDRVVIAHADTGTRYGARLALEEHGFRVVAASATAQHAIGFVRLHRPSACVIDARLPGAMNAMRAMAAAVPACAIVAVSAAPGHAEVCAAIRSGASAYVGSDIDPEMLVHTVRGALAGEAVIPTATARWIVARLQAGIPADEDPDESGTRRLTERHWQVLALLERSLTTAEIADELGVSP